MFIHACEYLGVQHGTSFMTRWHRKRANAGTFLLSKCSHDLDLLNWLTGSKPCAVASFGGTNFFVPGRGGASHCSACGRADTCAYRVGLEWHFLDGEQRLPGRDLCAFNDDKDVVDNQVVLLEYANGIRATFELQLFHARGTRRITIGGQHGYLDGDMETGRLVVRYNAGDRTEESVVKAADDSGHGGADFEFTRAFAAAVRSREAAVAGAEAGLAANVIADAVEAARTGRHVVTIAPAAYEIG
jgi:predicted dehydrogenase